MSIFFYDERQPRLNAILAPISLFERLGRGMMDFGFGSLVSKFEEYFGRKVTAALLAVIGFAVFGWAIHYGWSLIVRPIVKLISEYGLTVNTFYNIFALLILVGGLTSSSFAMLQGMESRRKHMLANALIKEAKTYRDEAANYKKEVNELLKDIDNSKKGFDNSYSTATLMLEASVLMLQSQGSIGQEKVDEILSLLDTVPEKQL